jgi:hypothetical protein
VIKILSTETETQTLDSLQQTAMAFRVITHESTELSDESQVKQNILKCNKCLLLFLMM